MSAVTVPSTSFSEILFVSDFSEQSDRADLRKKHYSGFRRGTFLVHVAQLAPVLALADGAWVDDPLRIRAEEQEIRGRGCFACGRFESEGLVSFRLSWSESRPDCGNSPCRSGDYGNAWKAGAQSTDLRFLHRRDCRFPRNPTANYRPAGAPCHSRSLETSPNPLFNFLLGR